MEVQDEYGVRYLKYWFNEKIGKGFCLVDAPNREAARDCHQNSHGLVAHKIIDVDDDMVSQFLDTGYETSSGAALLQTTPKQQADGGFRVILFTDIVGSTELTSRLGDAAAMDILRTHNELIRGALKNRQGREVKNTGDGIMASFVSPSNAVHCAMEVQRGITDVLGRSEEPLRVRVGISAGEPVEESNDIFGVAVQIAARTCAECPPGGILVSNVIRELCVGKGLPFASRGNVQLKGIDHPVHLHEVPWETGAS